MSTDQQDPKSNLQTQRNRYIMNIRKEKKNQALQQKRERLSDLLSNKDVESSSGQNSDFKQSFDELALFFLDALETKDYKELVVICEQINMALSNNENVTINQLISTGIIPQMIKILSQENLERQLVVEISSIIFKAVSEASAYVDYIVNQDDFISEMLNLLDHPIEKVQENVICALSVLAKSSLELKYKLLDLDIATKLGSILDGNLYSLQFLTHLSGLLCNLCTGKPYPHFEKISPLIDIARFLILKVKNEAILDCCLQTLLHISNGCEEQIKAVFDLNISDQIIALTFSENDSIAYFAMHIIGNFIASSNHGLATVMIKHGIIPQLSRLQGHHRRELRKLACWTISNLTAGPSEHMKQVFAYKGGVIIKNLAKLAYREPADIAYECVFALRNMSASGRCDYVQILLDNGLLELIVLALKGWENQELQKLALEIFDHLLRYRKLVMKPLVKILKA